MATSRRGIFAPLRALCGLVLSPLRGLRGRATTPPAAPHAPSKGDLSAYERLKDRLDTLNHRVKDLEAICREHRITPLKAKNFMGVYEDAIVQASLTYVLKGIYVDPVGGDGLPDPAKEKEEALKKDGFVVSSGKPTDSLDPALANLPFARAAIAAGADLIGEDE